MKNYTQRELAKVPKARRAVRAFELGFAGILCGPTSGGNAERLATLLTGTEWSKANASDYELAERERVIDERTEQAARALIGVGRAYLKAKGLK